MAAPLPERILIIRLGAIGDVVNALVVPTAIKEHHPGVTIGWAVHELALLLVEGHPSLDRVHLWRRGGGVRAFRAFLRGIKKERYDLVVDLQRILKSAVLARMCRAKRVLGFDRARAKELSWMWTREKLPPADPNAHMVRQYMEFVRYLGIPAAHATHLLPTDPEAEAWADGVVASLDVPPIVIGVGASKPENRWPAKRFGELAQACIDEFGLAVCLTGGPDDEDVGAKAWKKVDGLPGARNLVGKTSLRQLIALARRARMFVGCDTGPMHLAAVVGTPVVALFGPADPGRTGPWGQDHRVVRAPGVRGRMKELRVDVVLTTIREQLLE